MTLIIENNSNLISEQEITELLTLVDEKHIKSIQKIILFRNRLDVIKNFKVDFKTLSSVLRGKFMGFHAGGTIFLFPFLLERFKVEQGDKKFLLTHILFHEIRHAYQKCHLKDISSDENYSLMSKNYSEQWAERDANDYAYQMIKEKRSEILETLLIKESALFKNKDSHA